jgi:hypothetical protein
MTTTRRSLRLAAHSAVALSLAVLTIGIAPVHAASAIQIDARVLVGGRYEVGGWAAVTVSLVNEGTPTAGHLTAETDAGIVRRYVEMPAGARKSVTLYVRPGGFQREIAVRYVEPNGTVEAIAQVRVLDVSTRQVAIVGDAEGTLRPQFAGQPGTDAPDPIALAAADVPERPEPLTGIDVIVWAGDSGSLGDAQRRSIERWVGDGGQLVVTAGADWQARTSGLAHRCRWRRSRLSTGSTTHHWRPGREPTSHWSPARSPPGRCATAPVRCWCPPTERRWRPGTPLAPGASSCSAAI